ncbi:4-(cytidine 5'-diphospho)-2-C-methyl-D-erythritol kinase [Pseudooceanicola aestuarii]|uniref:4-(cytidine 5'-diphospho)-2-C-methyl-D-erythritol kinase n=1 Tax=Pseudooceanicola aestuarii TaxID=2697319 RepID=UPI001EF91EDD|nr:4-(cytidine 5'-diphospho)-2-C-methyl-D-erythritol kinase [Pseudooceanicola aestuarii]
MTAADTADFSITGTRTANSVRVFAPAKVNLALHVTGQQADGLHLLDSLVVFADIGDRLIISPAASSALQITGPMRHVAPATADNLALRAAAWMGHSAAITLEKSLPAGAGLGGGSADAAAVLRGLALLHDRPPPEGSATLGADIPVCLLSRAARMRGIGQQVSVLPPCPALPALLVNPGLHLATPRVFQALERRDFPPLPARLPEFRNPGAVIDWLVGQRNDLEPPAIALAPQIGTVLSVLRDTGAALARMSGSGTTCFGLYPDQATAQAAQSTVRAAYPAWWVQAVTLR